MFRRLSDTIQSPDMPAPSWVTVVPRWSVCLQGSVLWEPLLFGANVHTAAASVLYLPPSPFHTTRGSTPPSLPPLDRPSASPPHRRHRHAVGRTSLLHTPSIELYCLKNSTPCGHRKPCYRRVCSFCCCCCLILKDFILSMCRFVHMSAGT